MVSARERPGSFVKGGGYQAIGQATSDAAIGRYGFLMTTVFVALGSGELLPGRLEREFRADYFEGWLLMNRAAFLGGGSRS